MTDNISYKKRAKIDELKKGIKDPDKTLEVLEEAEENTPLVEVESFGSSQLLFDDVFSNPSALDPENIFKTEHKKRKEAPVKKTGSSKKESPRKSLSTPLH